MAKKSKRELAALGSATQDVSLTLADVAKQAGVSPITASRALNRPELVNEATRKRVLETVQTLGYVPNLLAGGLASSKSRLVAILLPTINHSLFSTAVQAMMDRLTEAGYQSLLGSTGYSAKKEEILLEAILGRRPDGVVLTGTLHTESSRRRLASAGIPVVEAWDLGDSALDMQIGFSHEQVGQHIAQHFFAKGYRDFAVITADDPRGLRRTNSLVSQLKQLGITHTLVETLPLPATWQVGREGLRRLLKRNSRPQLVICSSDILALGVLAEAASMNLHIPDDLAVLGFGNITESEFAYPALSTVSVNAPEMGRQIAEALLGRFADKTCNLKLRVDTGFTLLERFST